MQCFLTPKLDIYDINTFSPTYHLYQLYRPNLSNESLFAMTLIHLSVSATPIYFSSLSHCELLASKHLHVGYFQGSFMLHLASLA